MDRWFWPLESFGKFTVKSIHTSLVSHKLTNVAPLRRAMWKALWKIKVQDRFKLLLWKVAWEVIPTKTAVAALVGGTERGSADLSNALCGEQPETLQHLLLLCPFSRTVWSESPWQLDIIAFRDDTIVG